MFTGLIWRNFKTSKLPSYSSFQLFSVKVLYHGRMGIYSFMYSIYLFVIVRETLHKVIKNVCFVIHRFNFSSKSFCASCIVCELLTRCLINIKLFSLYNMIFMCVRDCIFSKCVSNGNMYKTGHVRNITIFIKTFLQRFYDITDAIANKHVEYWLFIFFKIVKWAFS